MGKTLKYEAHCTRYLVKGFFTVLGSQSKSIYLQIQLKNRYT